MRKLQLNPKLNFLPFSVFSMFNVQCSMIHNIHFAFYLWFSMTLCAGCSFCVWANIGIDKRLETHTLQKHQVWIEADKRKSGKRISEIDIERKSTKANGYTEKILWNLTFYGMQFEAKRLNHKRKSVSIFGSVFSVQRPME